MGWLTRMNVGRRIGMRCYSDVGMANDNAVLYSFLKFGYEEASRVRSERVSREWERYKNVFERPFLERYEEVMRRVRSESKKPMYRVRRRDRVVKNRLRKIKKAREEEKIEKHEFNIQQNVKDLLMEEDVTFGHYLTSAHPNMRHLLNTDMKKHLDAFNIPYVPYDDDAASNDLEWSIGHLNSRVPPSSIKHRPDYWKWEKALPPNEFARILTGDILKYGLSIREGRMIDEGSLKGEIDREYQVLTTIDSNQDFKGGRAVPLDIRQLPLNVDAPSILEECGYSSGKGRSSRNRIFYGDYRRPIIVETNYTPSLHARSKVQPTRFFAKFDERKVKLYIRIPALQLPKVVEERLILLAGKHYDSTRKLLTVVSNKKPTMEANKGNVFSIARAMFNEAWKADPNYVPPLNDPLDPHLLVEQQLEVEKRKKSEKELLDPRNFLKPNQYIILNVIRHPKPIQLKNLSESSKKNFDFLINYKV